MITIVHENDGCEMFAYVYETAPLPRRRYTDKDYDDAYNESQYALGLTKPHYPVPAIPIEVKIYPASVCFYREEDYTPFLTWWRPDWAKEMKVRVQPM